MNEERKPALERLFAAANRELSDEDFVARVMARTSAPSARRILAVLAVVLVAAPATWLATGPLADALLWLTRALLQPVAGSGEGFTSPTVLPMNSVGAAIALALVALRAIAKRLFAENT